MEEAKAPITKMDQNSTWPNPALPNQIANFAHGAPSEYGMTTMVQGKSENSGQENITEQCQGESGVTFCVQYC